MTMDPRAGREVLVERSGSVLILTLNRPATRNAADLKMAQQLADALDDFDKSDSLRVGIITGAGGTFCSGMDLKAFLSGERPSLPGRGFLGLTERPPTKPLIAAVEGYALAGGFETALACDLIVAASNAKFGLPEVKRGLVAGAGGLLRLPELIPPNVAMELALTGQLLDAARAREVGLVNRLVKPGYALEEAIVLAQAIGANGPLAVQASKRIIKESKEWSDADRFERQRSMIEPVFQSADAREGALAFAEKRTPVWAAH